MPIFSFSQKKRCLLSFNFLKYIFFKFLGPPTNKAQKGIDFYFKSDGTKKTGNPSGGGGNPNKKAFKGKRIQ